jgi:hypothetical protein
MFSCSLGTRSELSCGWRSLVIRVPVKILGEPGGVDVWVMKLLGVSNQLTCHFSGMHYSHRSFCGWH